jgi:hypothetical protein
LSKRREKEWLDTVQREPDKFYVDEGPDKVYVEEAFEDCEIGPDPIHGLDAPHPDWRCDYNGESIKNRKRKRKC